MSINIANVASNNTFDFHRSITNQIATALRNIVVTTNQNVATGNAIVNGYITANGIIANSLIIDGTVTLNVATSNLIINGLTSNTGIFTTLTANILNVVNTANIADLTVNTVVIEALSGNSANVNTLNVVQTLNTSNLIATGVANIASIIGVANAVITQLLSNVIIANTQLKIGNSASGNITINFPNTIQSNGSYFLNGNGSWALPVSAAAGSNTQVQYNNSGVVAGNSNFTFNVSAATLQVSNSITSNQYYFGNTTTGNITAQKRITLASAGDQIIDSFSTSSFRSAKYFIQAANTTSNSYYFTDINIIHNGNTTPIWIQSVNYSNTEFVSISVYANSTAVIVNANPTLTGTVFNIQKTLMAV